MRFFNININKMVCFAFLFLFCLKNFISAEHDLEEIAKTCNMDLTMENLTCIRVDDDCTFHFKFNCCTKDICIPGPNQDRDFHMNYYKCDFSLDEEEGEGEWINFRVLKRLLRYDTLMKRRYDESGCPEINPIKCEKWLKREDYLLEFPLDLIKSEVEVTKTANKNFKHHLKFEVRKGADEIKYFVTVFKPLTGCDSDPKISSLGWQIMDAATYDYESEVFSVEFVDT